MHTYTKKKGRKEERQKVKREKAMREGRGGERRERNNGNHTHSENLYEVIQTIN